MADDFRSIRRELRGLEQRVAAIESRVTRIASALQKVEARTRRTVVPLVDLPVGVTSFAVLWSTPYPDTVYAVTVAITSGQAALGTLHATLQAAGRTPEGCTILVLNSGVGVIPVAALDVLAFRSS